MEAVAAAAKLKESGLKPVLLARGGREPDGLIAEPGATGV